MLLVSAVVPVYNSFNTLERAIKSLLIQPEITEIFVVDDGSSDGSYEFEIELQNRYPIIKILTHPNRVNRGAASSRNLGMSRCSNEWIQFLDADDELHEFKISSQLKLIKDGTSLVVGSSFVHSSRGVISRIPLKDPFSGVLCGRLGDTCSNLWSKAVIDKVGGWNENLINSQEYELMFRVLRVFSKIEYSLRPMTNIFYQPFSITFSNTFKFEKGENQIRLKNSIRQFLIENKLFSLKREFFYSVGICNFKRFHRTEMPTFENYYYYFFYKGFKFFTDRL